MNQTLSKKKSLGHRFILALTTYKSFYIMLIPGLAFIVIFCYGPMFGLAIAFQNFKVAKGVFNSPWVGFANFTYLLGNRMFIGAFWNTVMISLYKILFGFPVPIILALLINEVRLSGIRRTVQTIIYLPHFMSWVTMFGLIFVFLGEFGPLNYIIKALGDKAVFFLSDTRYFRGLLVVSDIWKEMGWNSVIYLAALAGVSQELYESAVMDGASRIRCILSISLPSIAPTIAVMFLLRIGGILNAGFEQIFIMYNPSVFSVADIIDTYVYRIGLVNGNFGVSAAAGMFKSVIACVFVIGTNQIMKFFDQESLW